MLRWPITLDVDALALRVLTPARPQLARATAALEGIVAPREALECAVAHGLCPSEWINDEARAFGGEPPSITRVPYQVHAVLAMVSDPIGLVTAEELAREAHRRALKWTTHTSTTRTVFWKISRTERLTKGVRTENMREVPFEIPLFSPYSVRDSLWETAMVKVGLESFPNEPARGVLSRLLRRATGRWSYEQELRIYWLSRWGEAAAERRASRALSQAIEDHRRAWAHAILANAGARLRDVQPAKLIGSPVSGDVFLADLPNVFEPLAQLWWTGYAPHYVHIGRIGLHLPRIELSSA
jgi:hypothetical protein